MTDSNLSGIVGKSIKNDLFALQDKKYKEFQSKLIPNISPDTIIGVRTPALRKYAKESLGILDAELFMDVLPHEYFEEYAIHGFLIENLKDFDEVIRRLDALLPYIDNWANCDQLTPKVFKKNTEKLLPHVMRWIESDFIYMKRFGIRMLMCFYLDEKFDVIFLDTVSQIRSDEYYIKMMVAWYFATALSKQFDDVLPYIKERKLDVWTHNKAIQKSIESYRITAEQKEVLRRLKTKPIK
ncbi:MAG: DNA alkylation repair protein [Ruminococcaceae bacterium]|nr:DNA alkylation repair protein [Oscillospiraceae bacterium]